MAIVCTVFVSACGAVSGGFPSASSASESLGQIHGQVMRGPGVDPRAGGSSGALIPVSGDPIEVRDAQGKVVTQAVSAQDGSFRVDVAPGAYTVVESICAVKAQVEVRSQAIAELTLTIPNSC